MRLSRTAVFLLGLLLGLLVCLWTLNSVVRRQPFTFDPCRLHYGAITHGGKHA